MTEYTIRYHTGDKVLLEYDHAAHSYVVEEERVPNVTTLIDGVFPKYLTEWASKCGAEYSSSLSNLNTTARSTDLPCISSTA